METKDSDQAQISLSFAGISRQDPNRYALRLLNILLGEGMRSRLFQEVRERLGLAYVVGSYVTTMQDTGTVGAYAGVAEERTEEAIQAILAQFDLHAARIGAEERIAGFPGVHPGTDGPFAGRSIRPGILVRPPGTAGAGGPGARGSLHPHRSVRAEDIQRMAQLMFRPDRLNLAIVAPFSDNGDRFRQVANF